MRRICIVCGKITKQYWACTSSNNNSNCWSKLPVEMIGNIHQLCDNIPDYIPYEQWYRYVLQKIKNEK